MPSVCVKIKLLSSACSIRNNFSLENLEKSAIQKFTKKESEICDLLTCAHKTLFVHPPNKVTTLVTPSWRAQIDRHKSMSM